MSEEKTVLELTLDALTGTIEKQESEIDKLKKALRDCINTQYNGSFPDRYCAVNRARMLLEEIGEKEW